MFDIRQSFADSIDPIDQSWRLLKWWPAILKQVEVGAPGATYLLEVNPKNKIQPL